MKKIGAFSISMIAGLVIGYAGLGSLLSKANLSDTAELNLPAGFPSNTLNLVIWGILFILWGIGSCLLYAVELKPRRQRNIFLNSLILIVGIYLWHFMLFSAVNLSGALAISIALFMLGIVVWFMYLVIQRYAGYLFIPTIIWLIYMLYLSISVTVIN